jgi:N-acetylglucosamine kinase-like BadF-type ATPase
MLAATMRVDIAGVQAMTDIELACHAAGDGYVVYAGTGSIAAFIDAKGALQRAGGRGAIIDDAGGGHWIAREALRRIWRAEDDCPGAWRDSPMATKLFAAHGGSEWAQTRAWVYGASRGELGTLALAVARPQGRRGPGRAVPADAGRHRIARLVLALIHRHGPRPLVMAGRVFNAAPGGGSRPARRNCHPAPPVHPCRSPHTTRRRRWPPAMAAETRAQAMTPMRSLHLLLAGPEPGAGRLRHHHRRRRAHRHRAMCPRGRTAARCSWSSTTRWRTFPGR